MRHMPLMLPEHSSCSFWVCQAGGGVVRREKGETNALVAWDEKEIRPSIRILPEK